MNIDVQTLLIEMAKAKMSIKELSEKSEVCRGTIAAIKKGSEVKPETVRKIAEARGVSVEELLEERRKLWKANITRLQMLWLCLSVPRHTPIRLSGS